MDPIAVYLAKAGSKMKTYLVSGNSKGPKVLISAGVHGDEYEPILAVLKIVDLLSGKLVSGEVRLCPVVNTGAFLNGSRLGDEGLDVARICPGKHDGTRSEVAAAEISRLIGETDYYIDLHTGGSVLDIIPLAGYMLHPSPEILGRQQMMAAAFGLPVVWGTDYRPSGRTLSVARDCHVPAIYAEYGGGQGINKKVVDAYVLGCMNVLGMLDMIETEKRAEGVCKYWVEDHTQDSGYLQGKLPSPATGLFVAEVELWDIIEKGRRWGSILDPVTGKSVYAEADRAGMVIMKRVMPFVRKGDSLGYILPVTGPGKFVINE